VGSCSSNVKPRFFADCSSTGEILPVERVFRSSPSTKDYSSALIAPLALEAWFFSFPRIRSLANLVPAYALGAPSLPSAFVFQTAFLETLVFFFFFFAEQPDPSFSSKRLSLQGLPYLKFCFPTSAQIFFPLTPLENQEVPRSSFPSSGDYVLPQESLSKNFPTNLFLPSEETFLPVGPRHFNHPIPDSFHQLTSLLKPRRAANGPRSAASTPAPLPTHTLLRVFPFLRHPLASNFFSRALLFPSPLSCPRGLEISSPGKICGLSGVQARFSYLPFTSFVDSRKCVP